MSESEIKGRGRPSRWGKGDSDVTKIAADIEGRATLTPYYVQKLIEMGMIEMVVTEKGQAFIDKVKV